MVGAAFELDAAAVAHETGYGGLTDGSLFVYLEAQGESYHVEFLSNAHRGRGHNFERRRDLIGRPFDPQNRQVRAAVYTDECTRRRPLVLLPTVQHDLDEVGRLATSPHHRHDVRVGNDDARLDTKPATARCRLGQAAANYKDVNGRFLDPF